jgi:RNA polymerase sigma factor (sigma-70 family)
MQQLRRGVVTTLNQDSTRGGAGHFTRTQWSVVLLAAEQSSPPAIEALEKLCRTYWYPLYAFVRRRGYGVADAQDLTQEFFSRLLEKRFLDSLDRTKGKFRSFLLAALEHFLAKEWRRANAQKRGGGKVIFSLDDDTAETRYASEPADALTPEKIYERRWAMTLLEQTLARLREECISSDKTRLYELLKGSFSGERNELSYAAIAAQLGTNEGAIKVAAHRLRRRYGELLREEIAQTVDNPEKIDEEVRCLFAALG